MIAPPHLIVGYDGSPLSDAALARAFRLLAHERFAMVHVVTVAQPDGDQVRLPSGEKMHLWSALQTLRHIIEATTMDDCADKEHVRVVAHVLLGEPAATLVDFSYRYHATRIFLGARGLSSKGLEVGSVAAEVLALSEIPVHLESPLPSSSSIPPCGRTFGHELRGQSLFGPKLPPWRSPALA